MNHPPYNLAEIAKTLMPPGMKFCPTDQEMIVNYLYQKITDRLTIFQREIVKECDLYGDEEPWQIWEQYKASTVVDMEHNLYFFTRLKTKNTSGKRILRRVGRNDGTWHGEDAGSKINCSVMVEDEEVCLLGYKKRFNYRNPKSDQHGLWIMHEYSLPCTDYVICRLKYSKSSPMVSSPFLLPPPPPPPITTAVTETRPWISLACGSGDEISSTCGETSKQGGKNGPDSEQIEVEKVKKDDQEMIEQKNEKSVSAAEAKIDETMESDDRKKVNEDNENNAHALEKPGLENEGSNSVELNDLDDGEMTSEKKEIVFPIVRNPVLESSDGETKVKKNIDREMNDQKKGVTASGQTKVNKNIDREMNDQKKGVTASGEAKAKKNIDREMNDQKKGVTASGETKVNKNIDREMNDQKKGVTSSGEMKAKKNIDREMNDQKKGVTSSAQAKIGYDQKKGVTSSAQARIGYDQKNGVTAPAEAKIGYDQKKGVTASGQAKIGLDNERGSSGFEKNGQAKGTKDYEKAKSDLEMNDFQRKGKETSVNALMDRLFKKDELVTKPLPKTGRGRGKRPGVEQGCTGEDESTSNKKPRGSMDILIEALGLNK